MTNTSILVQRIVDAQLRAAKQQIERDGALQPLLYVHIAGDTTLEMPLQLSGTFEEKSRYFWELGHHLHKRGLQPREAVLVSESWVVAVREAPATMKFAPSEHPSRQEAVILIGRNADGSRYTQVVQPFTRDKHNRPIWQTLLLAGYDEPPSSGHGSAGLLDFFFEPMAVNLR